MSVVEPNLSVSSSLVSVVENYADVESPTPRHDAREKWQSVIDYTLIEWGSDPGQLEDEGLEPPSREVIQLAIRCAQAYKDEGRPAPDRIVPDPNGGIVFERQEGDVSEEIHVWDDGTVEYCQFHGARLVVRQTL